MSTHESASPTRVTAFAGGNFKTGTGYEGDEIAVAIKNSDNTEAVWRGSSTILQVAELWNNTASPWTGFNVGALAAVNPDSTAAQEIAGFLPLIRGNLPRTKDSISAFGIYYRADVAPSTEPAADRTQLLRRTRVDTIADCLPWADETGGFSAGSNH